MVLMMAVPPTQQLVLVPNGNVISAPRSLGRMKRREARPRTGHPTDIFCTDPPPSCICVICLDIVRDASSLKECGHTFCNECIKSCTRQDLDNRCPNCRVDVTGSNPNYALREIIEAMPVKCPEWKSEDISNRKRKRGDDNDDGEDSTDSGCDWKGTVKDLKDHEKVCRFTLITCKVEGCEHACKRKDMERHLSSGTGMLKHMGLTYENKMEAMQRKYEAKMEELESKMRMESNHMRYSNDCRDWIEHNRSNDLPFSFKVHQIRAGNVAGTPISGLLCEIVWKGGRIPMMLRYKSVMYPPICVFPRGFFHINVHPGGTLLPSGLRWSSETTLPEILSDVLLLLNHPKPEFSCNPKALDVYEDSASAYAKRTQREASKYTVAAVSHPKAKKGLYPGEELCHKDITTTAKERLSG